jgi:hypothetical protein
MEVIMPILRLTTNTPGYNHQNCRLVTLYSNDTIATCTAAGYLNNYLVAQSIALGTTDFIHLAASDGTQIYKAAFTGGTPQNGGSVQLVALS